MSATLASLPSASYPVSLAPSPFGDYVLKRTTTDATPARLTKDGAAPTALNTILLPVNSCWTGTITLAARSATGDKYSFVARFNARRDATAAGANVNVLASSTTTGTFGVTTGWAVTLSADTVNGGIVVNVTGEAGKTIHWLARISTVELAV